MHAYVIFIYHTYDIPLVWIDVYLYVKESGRDEIILESHCISKIMWCVVFKHGAVTLEPYV